MMEARPTNYRGTQMRSRLEATYAQVCDHLGIPWAYEPGALASEAGQWLPDFVHPHSPMRGKDGYVWEYGDAAVATMDRVLRKGTQWYVDVKPPKDDRRRFAAEIYKWHRIAVACDPTAVVVAASPCIALTGSGPEDPTYPFAKLFGYDSEGHPFGCLLDGNSIWWWPDDSDDQLLGLLNEYWPRSK